MKRGMMPPAITTLRAPWIKAQSPATLPNTAQNRANACRAGMSWPSSAVCTTSAGSRSGGISRLVSAPALRSTASISDKPLPHNRRSVEVRPCCAVSHAEMARSSSPSGAKPTCPPSVSTTCQPHCGEPTSSATPSPVPGPSTLMGPCNGVSKWPCRVTRSSACRAGMAHATAPKSLSMRSSENPSVACSSRRENDHARLVRRISSLPTGQATASAARLGCADTPAK